MSKVDGTCEYVLDPDKPETWGGEEGDECHVRDEVLNEDGVWTCPHDAEEGKDRCIFHQPVDEKSDEKAVDAFLDTVDEATSANNPEARQRRLEFIGAKFGDFELGEDSPDVLTDEAVIVMSYVQIDGRFEWSVDVSHILFRGATFVGDAVFESTEFSGVADFRSAEFGGWTNFMSTESSGEGKISFLGAEFIKKVNFDSAEFGCVTSFRGSEFRGEVIFKSVGFREKTLFPSVEFGKGASFRSAEFGGWTNFSSAEFRGDALFQYTRFEGKAEFTYTEFGGVAYFYKGDFGKEVDFESADFGDVASFTDVEFGSIISYMQAKFNKEPDFAGIDMTGANFEEAHLDGADFDGADLSGANLERATLSNADLFETDLSGARLYGARIEGVTINTETVFDRHGKHRCVYDPNSEYEYEPDEDEEVDRIRKAMGAYHVLEQLTRENTLPSEQSKFFARRQDMRRAQLRQDEEFPRFRYWFSEVQNVVFRHGESFSRVVGCSVGTIVFFALVFPLGGWVQSESTGTITYGRIAESPLLLWQTFYHSTLLFLTGGGPLDTTGTIGEVLTTVEALVAPILLALLVFVLGRRAAR